MRMTKHRWRRGLALMGSLAVLLIAAGCGAPGTTAGSPDAGGHPDNATTNSSVSLAIPGHPAPAVVLTDLQTGKSVSLKQLLGSKPILLNVWASWCHPCNAETPELVQASKEYGKQVEFVGVDLTSFDTVAKEKAFVAKYHVPYRILSDTTGKFYKSYGIEGVPTTYVIDSKGVIAAVHTGQIPSKAALNAIVQEAIKAG